ncbi:alpha/beta hydrolase [uncultured Cohaesibacter sp.]|uniref:alpha/beta fold hydrolase n=1 Tax=uncultured Cohaesibacter sp. TaxID=1002546 RepID=UPI0029C998EB|nr:alpha/beta hydrolase [uncultured Cohaesibacter sp.]
MFTYPKTHLTETRRGPVELSRFGSRSGPAILSLHGGMGGCDQGSLLAMSAFADWQNLDIIAPARPGYLSTPIKGRQSLEQQADLFAALLDSEAIESATLIAISAGGPSAITFAARHPDRCKRLILISACSGHLPTKRQIFVALAIMKLAARSDKLVSWMKRKVEQDPWRAASRSIPDPDLIEQTLTHPEAGPYMQALQTSIYDRMAERLPGTICDTRAFAGPMPLSFDRIKAPTLIIHGDKDRIVPFDHAQNASEAIKTSRLHRIPGADHVALFTHMDEIRQATASFMTNEEQ